jgi:hypothetical protein
MTIPAKAEFEPEASYEQRVAMARTRMSNFMTGKGLVETFLETNKALGHDKAVRALLSDLWREKENAEKLNDALQRTPSNSGHLETEKSRQTLDIIRIQASIAALEDYARLSPSMETIETPEGSTLFVELDSRSQVDVSPTEIQHAEGMDLDNSNLPNLFASRGAPSTEGSGD